MFSPPPTPLPPHLSFPPTPTPTPVPPSHPIPIPIPSIHPIPLPATHKPPPPPQLSPTMSQNPSIRPPTTKLRIPSAAASYTPATMDPDLRSQLNMLLINGGHDKK